MTKTTLLIGLLLLIFSTGASAQRESLWKYYEKIDNFDDDNNYSTVFIMGEGKEDLSFGFECAGSSNITLYLTDLSRSFSNATPILLQVDKGEIHRDIWRGIAMRLSSPFNQNLSVSLKRIIREMLTGETLHFRTTDSDGERIEESMSLANFGEVVRLLSCYNDADL
ncbi:MAG: hypothetical protein ACR2PR_10920 [Pseudohongiellaceae bacterium]